MAATLIDGKAQAAALRAGVGAQAAAFAAEAGRAPGLAVVLVGDDPASAVYVGSKARAAMAAGIASFEHRLPATVSEDALLALVARLNADPRVDGILVQLPLPPHIGRARVLEAIDPAKDVDGFHPTNAGRLAIGRPALVPCTPLGVMHLLRAVVPDLRGLDVTVIGRSNIVGKPLGLLLGDAGCTVTAAQIDTRDTRARCREADVVVAAAGHPGLVRGDWVKPGAVVIDVGINRVVRDDGTVRLVGDVAFEEVRARCAFLTPVPGGVGPMTVAYLLANTLSAARARQAERDARPLLSQRSPCSIFERHDPRAGAPTSEERLTVPAK